jgi:hypothetical protein
MTPYLSWTDHHEKNRGLFYLDSLCVLNCSVVESRGIELAIPISYAYGINSQ